MIRFACPRCDGLVEVSAKPDDSRANCPTCGARLKIPRPARGSERNGDEEDPGPAEEEPRPRKRKRRRRRVARTDQAAGDGPAWVVPALVLAVGLGLSILGAADLLGPGRLLTVLSFSLVELVVATAITLVAMTLAAALLSVTFDDLGHAILRAAAMAALGNGMIWLGITARIPLLGLFLLGPLATLALVSLWFELELQERVVAVAIIWAGRWLITRWILLVLARMWLG